MLNRFMRTREGTPVEVVHQGTIPFYDSSSRTATVLIVYEHNGRMYNAYREADGTHPAAWTKGDLIDYDTASCATHIQARIAYPTYRAIYTLWQDKTTREAALDAAVAGTDLHKIDMAQYLRGLFGD